MLGNIVADIVVLGILHQSSVSQERVVAVAKTIVPDLWCPTSDFIRGAIVRNIKLKNASVKTRVKGRIPIPKEMPYGNFSIPMLDTIQRAIKDFNWKCYNYYN